MSLTEQKIDQIVKDIFTKYDSDKSGFLDKEQVFKMLEDSFKKMHKTDRVQMTNVRKFMDQGDHNRDGRIQKTQMKQIILKSIKVIPSPQKKRA